MRILRILSIQARKWQIALIIALTFLAYSNIFQNEFVIDDHINIENWLIIRDLRNIPEMFTEKSVPEGFVAYRPIRAVVIAVGYFLWKDNVFFFHILALGIHLGSTVLVYLIAAQLVGSGLWVEGSRKDKSTSYKLQAKQSERTTYYLPFIAALLFGLHPLHTEAITFITASIDSFGHLAFLGSLWAWIKVRNTHSKWYLWYLGSLALAFLSIYTNEPMVVLPLVIILYDFYFQKKLVWPRYIPYFFLAASYLFVRIVLLKIVGRRELFDETFFFNFLVTAKSFAKYVYLLIWPQKLSLDVQVAGDLYAHMEWPVVVEKLKGTIFNISNFFDLALIFGLLLVMLGQFKRRPLVSFSIAWFFITFIPLSSFLANFVIMQERYIYLASFGFCIVASLLILKTAEFLSKLKFPISNFQFLIFILLAPILTLYIFRTYLRNRDWKDDISFNKSTTETSPYNWGEYNHLGVKYGNVGQYDLAAQSFQRAIDIKPDFWLAHYNLANANLILGHKEMAISGYEKTLQLNPDYLPAKNTLKNLSIVKGGSILAHFQSKNGSLSFDFPAYWSVEQSREKVVIKDGKSVFTIEISEDRAGFLSIESYLKAQPILGNLVNQGSVLVPNFKEGYVRQWNDQGTEKLQFFLFKGQNVVKILAYPLNSLPKDQFDSSIATIKIDE